MAQGDDVAVKAQDLIKDHFQVRRDPQSNMSPGERKQLTNGFLYGVQHALDAVGGHPAEARLAADIRVHINNDWIDEANAMVGAL